MIALISYNTPHRKTQDLIFSLLARGHQKLYVIATPFVQRKSFVPIFRHRPSKAIDVELDTFCQRLNIELSVMNIDDIDAFLLKNSFEHIIISGAGILPENLVKNHKIINGHPGYLPKVKGLDALKWAIYKGEPIGVTTHYISEKVDEGLPIERRKIPVYCEDTFHSVAYRQYETEIEMLVNSIELIDQDKTESFELSDDSYTATRRMPHRLEKPMMERFNDLVLNSPSFASDLNT